MPCSLSQFFVLKIVRMNEFQHRVAKQKWILTVIESPSHFVEVGRQTLRRDSMPRSHNGRVAHPFLRKSKLDTKEGCPILPRSVRKGGRRETRVAWPRAVLGVKEYGKPR
jgi:hypothetical protein